jgi:hypothetical protein
MRKKVHLLLWRQSGDVFLRNLVIHNWQHEHQQSRITSHW